MRLLLSLPIASVLSLTLLPACTPPAAADKPHDTADSGAGDSADTTDDNTAPSAAVISLSPAAPSDLANLTVTLLTPSTDPEGDVVNYSYAWTVDGNARTDLTGNIVAADQTADLETWAVTVTPNDGVLDGPSATATATIGNVPPVAPTAHIDPSAPNPGDDLTLVFDSPATDANNDVLSQTITWYKNESKNTSWNDKTTVEGVNVTGGAIFRAHIAVADGLSDPVSVDVSVTAGNTPPVIKSVSITPTSPTDDDDLRGSASASDDDGNTLAYTYVWYRDGVEATDVGNAATVPASATIVGEDWDLNVFVSDGTDEVQDAASTVTIRAWTGYAYRSTIELTLAPDETTIAGTWAYDVETHAGRYGENDCDLWWSITGTEDSTVCPYCDYAFTTTATYDVAASTVATGCATLLVDGPGQATWESRYSSFYGRIDGPTLDTGSTYYYYYGYTPGISARVYGSGGYTSTYGSYTWTSYYSAVSAADTAGNTIWNVYSYRAFKY